MLSRRDFLKISGLTTAAAVSGYGAGKIFGSGETNSLRVQAFVPDVSSAAELTGLISRDAGSLTIKAGSDWKNSIENVFNQNRTSAGKGNLVVEIEKLKNTTNGDLLLSDRRIYNPSVDFNSSLNKLRTELKENKASYLYTAYYNNSGLLGSLLNSGTNYVVIENEDGLYDRIKLSGRSSELLVKGPSGKTGIMIENSLVHISSSCCRNGLCSKTGRIHSAGQMIACAPNRIIVRIERV
jgi:hypothetical protein